MMDQNNRICVGAILGAFGVKGELRVKSFCADPAAIADYGKLSNEDGTQQFDLRVTRPIKGGYAVRIKGVQFKDQADALKGTTLYAHRDALPSLPDDEFYHTDLIGLTVMDTGGEQMGKITAVHDHGAGDMIEVTGPGFKNPILIPFTKEIVPTIDLAQARAIVDLPDGVT